MSVCVPVVIIVDDMDLRRAELVHFLAEWAAQERVSLLSFRSEQACRELGDRAKECRMVVLNVGAASCSDPDVVLELKAVRALAPSAFLAVVADEENPEDVVASMHAGAAAYISNRSDPEMVLRALSFILQGGTYFPRRLVEVAMGVFSENPLSLEPDSAEAIVEDQTRSLSMADFSERQRSILAGVCRGEPNKIIGRRLGLPESTVKVHVREIMRKLGVSNRTQVAILASSLTEAIGDLPAPASKESSRPLLIPFGQAQKAVDRFQNARRLAEAPAAVLPPAAKAGSLRAYDDT